ncbi:MAG: hypothetical protein NDF56_05620 [archaeon GB-1845-036]|nr:hypothetical protein [Candidatus Culexmicrobium thermophilum]RLE54319.1 MAG: hypothetical protein DRJ30_05395 [Candidatus Verstraetearchaeota archaeon]HDO20286.1 hypothetical protein [Candidatus Bathyarchaeota archaeon]
MAKVIKIKFTISGTIRGEENPLDIINEIVQSLKEFELQNPSIQIETYPIEEEEATVEKVEKEREEKEEEKKRKKKTLGIF